MGFIGRFFETAKSGTPHKANAYWEQRKDVLYYGEIRVLVSGLSKKAKSILDVGSAGCPYLDWFPHIPVKTSIDLKRPYVAPGVTSHTCDFLQWSPDQKYDIVTCLQVLEHIGDAKAFAQKLLQCGSIVVISVPYKWPAGKTATHVQDPVDEEKVLSWFNRAPNYQRICTEIIAPVDRLIQVYDAIPEPWAALNKRDPIVNAARTARDSTNPVT